MCNTVWGDWSLENVASHAGEIKAYVSDLCAGSYDVTIVYSVHLWAEGEGDARAKIYDVDGKTIWTGSGSEKFPMWALHEKKTIRIKVSSKKDEVMVVNYIPHLEYSNTNDKRKMHAYGSIVLYRDQIVKVP